MVNMEMGFHYGPIRNHLPTTCILHFRSLNEAGLFGMSSSTTHNRSQTDNTVAVASHHVLHIMGEPVKHNDFVKADLN